jgi:transposase
MLKALFLYQKIKRDENDKWEVLPKRWIVERTFAWLMKLQTTGYGL